MIRALLGLIHLPIGLLLAVSASSEPLPTALQESVVLISPNSGDRCASGFFLTTGELVTNAHVAMSGCDGLDCSALSVATRSPNGEKNPLRHRSLRIEKLSAVFDIALLRGEFDNPPSGFELASQSDWGSVTALSFPLCKTLAQSTGLVEAIDPLWIYSTVVGKHGSSGGPLIDANFRVVGVVDEAASLLSAAKSILSGSEFQLRAVRFDHLPAVQGGQPLFPYEVANLLSLYQRSIAIQSGATRIRRALDFVASTEALIRQHTEKATPAELAALLNSMNGSPAEVLAQSISVDSTTTGIQLLALAYALESFGPYTTRFGGSAIDDLAATIIASNKTSADKNAALRILSDYQRGGFKGLQRTADELVGATLLLIIALFVLLAALFSMRKKKLAQ